MTGVLAISDAIALPPSGCPLDRSLPSGMGEGKAALPTGSCRVALEFGFAACPDLAGPVALATAPDDGASDPGACCMGAGWDLAGAAPFTAWRISPSSEELLPELLLLPLLALVLLSGDEFEPLLLLLGLLPDS